MWSKFYYFKKLFSNYAYIKNYNNSFDKFFKLIIFSLLDKRKRVIYYSQMSGLINSYMGYKSYKRLKL